MAMVTTMVMCDVVKLSTVVEVVQLHGRLPLEQNSDRFENDEIQIKFDALDQKALVLYTFRLIQRGSLISGLYKIGELLNSSQ